MYAVFSSVEFLPGTSEESAIKFLNGELATHKQACVSPQGSAGHLTPHIR